MAGVNWFEGFKQKHHPMRLKPEATLLGRATIFKEISVGRLFDNLGKVMNKYKLSAKSIHNVDETVVTTVQRPNPVAIKK